MEMVRKINFVWWNVQDFAHYEPNRSQYDRWPSSEDEYREKLRRVSNSIQKLAGDSFPEVLGLCEITKYAAEHLLESFSSAYELILSDPTELETFQVALYVKKNGLFRSQSLIFVQDGTNETRPMCVAEFCQNEVRILFIACHWTAFSNGREMRRRAANSLRNRIYEFLNFEAPSIYRHVVVMGDFNEEPFEDIFFDSLNCSRDRDHAIQKSHYTDVPVKRTRLYNSSWRLLGEEFPHATKSKSARRVGTYYSEVKDEWRTYDHVLLTGGLLSEKPPFFDERSLKVFTDLEYLENNKPKKFSTNKNMHRGVSDHYPLVGRINIH